MSSEEAEKYDRFATLFLAYGSVNGFGDIIKVTALVLVIRSTGVYDLKQIHDANTKGYSVLLHACRKHHKVFVVVTKARSDKSSEGNLPEAL